MADLYGKCRLNITSMDPMVFLGVGVPYKPSLAIVCWDWGHTQIMRKENHLTLQISTASENHHLV